MRKSNGFTLIETIVVIVLVGVLAAGAGLLIAQPIEAYTDQIRRAQLVDSAEMAIRRVAVDVRRALPNSIRVIDNSPNGWALEMVNTVDGARYRDEFGAGFATDNEILQFISTETDFNLLGLLTTLPVANYPTYRVVIYNTSPSDLYSDAANNTEPGIISGTGFNLTLSGGIEHHIQLSNDFQFEYSSPTQRLFIVDGPISYICDRATGRLTRFAGYAYQANQSAVDTVGELSALANVEVGRVASQVSNCAIDYDAGTAQRGGLITLQLAVTDNANESVQLLHQIHVENVP